jgi:hypothetical protein
MISTLEMIHAVESLDPEQRNPCDVNGSCVYMQDDKHCFVGEVLVRLGLPLPVAADNARSFYLITRNLDGNPYQEALSIDQCRILSDAQRIADKREAVPVTWREAREYALLQLRALL